MEQSTPDDNEAAASASSATESEDGEEGIVHELRQLSSSRRVSGIASAFRQRLESNIRSLQRPRSSAPSVPASRRASVTAVQIASRPTVDDHTASSRVDNERTRDDIAALRSAGRVAALLGDRSLRQRIERVLQARVQDPDGATRRALHDRDAIERRIASEPRPATRFGCFLP